MISIYKLYYEEHVYVGATKLPIQKRRNQHVNNAEKGRYPNNKLSNKMRELGPGRFRVILLGTAKTPEEAREMEGKFITELGNLNMAKVSEYSGTNGWNKRKKRSRPTVESFEGELVLRARIASLEAEVKYWKELALFNN